MTIPAAGGSSALTKDTRKMVQVAFTATREQVFKAFPAIANLADKSDGGKITIRVEGTCEQGYEASWLRNAVDEPLDEAGIEKKPGA